MLIETRGGISKPQHQSFLTRSRLIFITLFLSCLMIQDVYVPFPKEKALTIFYPLIEETRILFLTVYLATQGLLFRRNFHKYSLTQRNTSLFGGSRSRASLTVKIIVKNGDHPADGEICENRF